MARLYVNPLRDEAEPPHRWPGLSKPSPGHSANRAELSLHSLGRRGAFAAQQPAAVKAAPARMGGLSLLATGQQTPPTHAAAALVPVAEFAANAPRRPRNERSPTLVRGRSRAEFHNISPAIWSVAGKEPIIAV